MSKPICQQAFPENLLCMGDFICRVFKRGKTKYTGHILKSLFTLSRKCLRAIIWKCIVKRNYAKKILTAVPAWWGSAGNKMAKAVGQSKGIL